MPCYSTYSMKIYSPFTATPEQVEGYKSADEQAAPAEIPDEQFERYVEEYFTHYRNALERYFPRIAPYIGLYRAHPFTTFVLRLGSQMALIGHRPSSTRAIKVMRPADFDPPLTTINLFQVADLWQAAVIAFNFKLERYDAEEAETEAIRQALTDALEVFWLVLEADAFHNVCTELLRREGIEVLSTTDENTSDCGFDAISSS